MLNSKLLKKFMLGVKMSKSKDLDKSQTDKITQVLGVEKKDNRLSKKTSISGGSEFTTPAFAFASPQPKTAEEMAFKNALRLALQSTENQLASQASVKEKTSEAQNLNKDFPPESKTPLLATENSNSNIPDFTTEEYKQMIKEYDQMMEEYYQEASSAPQKKQRDSRKKIQQKDDSDSFSSSSAPIQSHAVSTPTPSSLSSSLKRHRGEQVENAQAISVPGENPKEVLAKIPKTENKEAENKEEQNEEPRFKLKRSLPLPLTKTPHFIEYLEQLRSQPSSYTKPPLASRILSKLSKKHEIGEIPPFLPPRFAEIPSRPPFDERLAQESLITSLSPLQQQKKEAPDISYSSHVKQLQIRQQNLSNR